MDTIRLHGGDAIRLLAGLPDASHDALITDPPYSSGGMVRGDRMPSTTKKYQLTSTARVSPPKSGYTRDMRAWSYWCHLWLSEAHRVLRPGSPVCVFADWRMLAALWDQGVNLDDWDYMLVVPASALATNEGGDTRPLDYGEVGYTHDLECLLTGCYDNRWYVVAFRGSMVGIGVAYHG